MKKLIHGKEVLIKQYNKNSDKKRKTLHLQIKGHDIMIIEGIMALSFGFLRDNSHVKIFKEIGTGVLKQKVYRSYRWKGYPQNQIESLFKRSLSDEYSLIYQDSKHADIII